MNSFRPAVRGEPEPFAEKGDAARAAELAANLAAVRARIAVACQRAARDPATVRLLAVTKYFPARDVAILARLGVRDIGESKVQEATAKVAELAESAPLRWHLVGRLQRNKVRSVLRWVDTIHTVDSKRLANAISHAADAEIAAGVRTDPVRVLLQVSLDADPNRGGVPPEGVPALAEEIASSSGLCFAGLMAIPPKSADPEAAFARVAQLQEQVKSDYPDATQLSAGMSGDLELAIAHGATCVRVGTALMGSRPITSS